VIARTACFNGVNQFVCGDWPPKINLTVLRSLSLLFSYSILGDIADKRFRLLLSQVVCPSFCLSVTLR